MYEPPTTGTSTTGTSTGTTTDVTDTTDTTGTTDTTDTTGTTGTSSDTTSIDRGECGDGIINGTEECDDGYEINAFWNDCTHLCTIHVCGDGLQYSGGEGAEQCDEGGETATCNADCTVPYCGNHIMEPNADEECDESVENVACDVDCTLPVCGDGHKNSWAGEGCDDGNKVDDDMCSNDCVYDGISGLFRERSGS